MTSTSRGPRATADGLEIASGDLQVVARVVQLLRLLAAHDELARLCGDDAQFAYETHVLLIRHGRRTCVARSPRCAECPLRRMCPEGRRRLARA